MDEGIASRRLGGLPAREAVGSLAPHVIMHRPLAILLAIVAALFSAAGGAAARSDADPIRVVWTEGDVAGVSTIFGPDGRDPVGFIEFHQSRKGDRLSSVRIARFRDGSSDEDWAEARIGETLETISGRSVIRDTKGDAVADVLIDVEQGKITASWGTGTDRQTKEEQVQLPKATYWGPLIFIVLKNFDANAEGGMIRFRSVAPTPKPMVLEMEMRQVEQHVPIERQKAKLDAVAYELRPNVHWTIDPLVHLVAPKTRFLVLPGDPPGLARYTGPRNYGRQAIRIE